MKQRGMLTNFLLFLMLGVTITASFAQELCEALVRDAWEVVTENCLEAGNQSACYGHDSLEATFTEAAAVSNFLNPSDQADLLSIQTVRTLPFDENEEEWGISDFIISAEPFGGSIDDSVRIFTTGDVIVENAAYAVEDSLPMQTFNFKTAGQSACREAPNAVFIQTPDGLSVDLNVNSTPIRLGSTVVTGTDVDRATGFDLMWFGVVEGTLKINPDTPEEIVVPQGSFTTTLLSNQRGQGLNNEAAVTEGRVPVLNGVTGEPILGPNGEPFFRQVPVTEFAAPEEITFDGASFAGWDFYRFVELIPDDLLSYAVDVPEPEPDTLVFAPVRFSVVPSATPNGAMNWCYAGGRWDDGRCNDPDPAVRDWYWNAGWYNAALASGEIDVIPEQYRNPTSVPTQGPPNPTATPPGPTPTPVPTTVCIDYTPQGFTGSSIIDTGVTGQNVAVYDTTDCTGPEGVFFALVFGADLAEANNNCATQFVGVPVANDYTNVYANLWRCSAT